MLEKKHRIATAEEDRLWTENFRKEWSGTPYPPVFVTVDNVITRHHLTSHGQVLLIRRGGMPGRGRLALPGGYIEQNERLADAALRELTEEATPTLNGQPVTAAQMQRYFVRTQIFDDPARSARGRVITSAWHFDLGRAPGGAAISFKAADDAADIGWHALNTLDPAGFFEDHLSIIRTFTE